MYLVIVIALAVAAGTLCHIFQKIKLRAEFYEALNKKWKLIARPRQMHNRGSSPSSVVGSGVAYADMCGSKGRCGVHHELATVNYYYLRALAAEAYKILEEGQSYENDKRLEMWLRLNERWVSSFNGDEPWYRAGMLGRYKEGRHDEHLWLIEAYDACRERINEFAAEREMFREKEKDEQFERERAARLPVF